MFGRLRGIKKHLLKPLCYSLINLLDLNDHSYKMCYTLSGGNKRKLSVAISLIGSPVLVLLDGECKNTFVIYNNKQIFFLLKYRAYKWNGIEINRLKIFFNCFI